MLKYSLMYVLQFTVGGTVLEYVVLGYYLTMKEKGVGYELLLLFQKY